MNNNHKIALLIDCDNISHQSIEGVLQELTKYGAVNIRHGFALQRKRRSANPGARPRPLHWTRNDVGESAV